MNTLLASEDCKTSDKRTDIVSAGKTLLNNVALLSAVSLLVSCFLVSPKKELWVDEGYSLQVITDPSITHIMSALAGGVDGGMPLYYLLAHEWSLLFGSTLLSLRLLSSLLLGTGLVVLCSGMRRYYAPSAVALGVPLTLLGSPLLIGQNSEVRFYGLFFALTAVVVVLHSRLAEGPFSPKLLVAALVANLALLFSHPFGVLYSGASVAALIFSDHRNGHLRWHRYTILVSSWFALLLWLKPIGRIYDLSRPHNWVPRPSFGLLVRFLGTLSRGFWLGLLLYLLIFVLTSRRVGQTQRQQSNALLYQGIAVLLLPFGILALALIGPSIFLDRYFLPSTLGAAILLTHLFNRILLKRRMTFACQLLGSLAILTVLVWPIYQSSVSPKDVTMQWLNQTLPHELPILVEDANTFVPLNYYASPSAAGYYYVVDWESALHSTSLHATVQTKLMRNAQAAGYGRGRIIDTHSAYIDFDSFIVLDSNGISWFEDRILNNPAFDSKKLADFGSGELGPSMIWFVKSLYRSPDCFQH